jgi:CheY-like chemotaxis protein
VLKLNLEVEGYEADTAYSAEEALQLNLSQYSLILLDIMMGEMNGIQMARRLKEAPVTRHIPIISKICAFPSSLFRGGSFTTTSWIACRRATT